MIAAMSLVLVFCAAELSRAAAGANAPVGEVKATIDEATPVFENRNLSPAEREVELSAIAEKHFDLTYMARSALGTIKLRQWVEKLGVPGFLIALGILSFAPLAWSQSPVAATDHPASANPQMQEVEGIPGLTRGPNGIPIGTKITMGNWQQYKSFMPDGLITLFEGTSFWKMPPDVEIDIGPTYNYPLPETFKEATQKYSGQVQLVLKPNGHWTLNNYYAGQPFPNPSEPDKGEKILADQWYAYGPHIAAVSPETGLASTCRQDHFLNRNCVKIAAVYRQLAFNTDPGVPHIEPGASDMWLTEWLMIEEPEESKYTADLTIFYQDPDKQESHYLFVPALRRSLRLSGAARCGPIFGTDFTHDDERAGFNGGISTFNATYLRDQKVIALANLTTAAGGFPQNYDMPLGFARPSWGEWSVRDTYVLDVRRIPQQAPGYCYGKRIMYVDKNFFHEQWMELYDAQMRLWKIGLVEFRARVMPNVGVATLSSLALQFWDMQNDHVTFTFTADGAGRDIVINDAVPKEYDDIAKYSTPAGLMQIMQ